MKKYELVSKVGQNYSITTPQAGNIKKGYLFAFAKSGSTLLDRMIRDYCKQVSVPTLSLFGECFQQGIKPTNILSDAKKCIEMDGIIYTGFRHYPLNFDIDLANSNQMLLVRDPRDMLVSLYFSISKSHVVLKGDDGFTAERESAKMMSLDSFVLERAASYNNNFKKYKSVLSDIPLLVSRYEDVIFEKEQWMKDIIKHFALPFDEKLILNVVNKYDIVPERENDNLHIRQVHPGNFLKKLQPDTIEKLNEILSEFLDEFSYIK